jgi:tRNA(fMet)-specific endonuclease VapC
VSAGYLLDTNILSAGFRQERLIPKRVSEVEHYLSPIVLGELYEGAFFALNRASYLQNVRTLIRFGVVLAFDVITSERFGLIAANLEQRGLRIPDNDMWIAAHALQYDLILVTRDEHFSRVSGLQIERW